MEKQTRRFRRTSPIVKLAPDVRARHGRIATVAFLSLGGSEAAALFLNTHEDRLGGRPLDIAGESTSGFDAVVAQLALQQGQRQAEAAL